MKKDAVQKLFKQFKGILKPVATVVMGAAMTFGAFALAGCNFETEKEPTGNTENLPPVHNDKTDPIAPPSGDDKGKTDPPKTDIPEKTMEDVVGVLNAALVSMETDKNFSLVGTSNNGEVCTILYNNNVYSVADGNGTTYYQQTGEGNFVYQQDAKGVWQKTEGEAAANVYLNMAFALKNADWTNYDAENNKLTGKIDNGTIEVEYQNDDTQTLADDVVKLSSDVESVQIYNLTTTAQLTLPEIAPPVKEEDLIYTKNEQGEIKINLKRMAEAVRAFIKGNNKLQDDASRRFVNINNDWRYVLCNYDGQNFNAIVEEFISDNEIYVRKFYIPIDMQVFIKQNDPSIENFGKFLYDIDPKQIMPDRTFIFDSINQFNSDEIDFKSEYDTSVFDAGNEATLAGLLADRIWQNTEVEYDKSAIRKMFVGRREQFAGADNIGGAEGYYVAFILQQNNDFVYQEYLIKASGVLGNGVNLNLVNNASKYIVARCENNVEIENAILFEENNVNVLNEKVDLQEDKKRIR